MKLKQKRKRLWALLLSAALVVTQLPVLAMAENNVPEDDSIASFAALDSGMSKQNVPVGTEESELNLPDTVTAKVYHVTEDTILPDGDDIVDEDNDDSTASPSDADDTVSGNDGKDSGRTVTTVTTEEIEIPVTWDSAPAYDGDRLGSYVFTADVEGFSLADGVKLPQITVTVGDGTQETIPETAPESQPEQPKPCEKTEGCTLPDGHEGECETEPPTVDNALVKTITGWTWIDPDEYLNEGELALPGVNIDQQADFDTVVSMLPAAISAEIDKVNFATGEREDALGRDETDPATVNITGWTCDTFTRDEDGNWPVTGTYTFTAELETGYALASSAAALEVKVQLGGGAVLAANNTITEYGITVAASNGGEAAYTVGSGFTLKSDGDYAISGTWRGSLSASADSEQAVITVPDGVTANVEISGVSIDVSGTGFACAFSVAAGGTAHITLSGENTLKSGSDCAGLQAPRNATVTIDGDGSLTATGGSNGAGIGGGILDSGGAITISGGRVTATGEYGAGIGGGECGYGGKITISSGTVTATGEYGAGIGGGFGGNGDSIKISGGTVKAASNSGAGIGGGEGGEGGTIKISGGTVTANGNRGAGIGGGYYRKGGTVSISGQGTTVTATSGNGSHDVGSGSGSTNGGSLSVTDGATLEMTTTGTNVTDPVYKNCTIIDKDKNEFQYNENGNVYNNTEEQDGIKIIASDGGEVTYTAGSGFTLNASGDYAISGTWSGSLTAGADSRQAVITVPDGVTAIVTLDGVAIDVSVTRYACAFSVAAGGTANITLSGENTLKSGSGCAGLQVPENATVTIDGAGSLEATGGNNSAGIGGGFSGSGGTIEISGGTVTANGGYRGAGIGGGIDGSGGKISISGGMVTASGGSGSGGAGIGGGFSGSGGTIEISSGTVTANGGSDGAGIGGSGGGDGGTIAISGGTVKAAGGSNGAGIGGGGSENQVSGSGSGSGGTITISGSAQVEATGGMYSAGIGGHYYDNSGGTVSIFGRGTTVTATSGNGGHDVGSGRLGSDGGSLSVTDGATLVMKNTGIDAKNPVYKNCTIIDRGNRVEYNSEGKPIASPALSLTADPAGAVDYPESVTLTATLSGASPDNSGKTITFTANRTHTATTDSSGKAACTITNLTPGTYTFGASFAGDAENKAAAAAEISGFTVNAGTQAKLTLIGLGSAYTYGDASFNLSTSGGSGNGAVSYASSNPSVASVAGNTVTVQKAGTFTITATKAGDNHYKAASVTSGEVTVSQATPGISMTATGGSNTTTPIVLTATVSKVGTGGTPTGTVTFGEGSKILAANVSLDGSGTASFTINTPEQGSHTYTAAYSGQTDYYSAGSVSRTIGVGLTEQTGFSITQPGTKTYGDGDFTLAATGGQGTGGVSFSALSGNGVLAVASDGKVKITGAGKVTVTATKEGDNRYNAATATQDITVAPRDISNVTVNVTGSHVYTGSQLQPVFEVRDSGIAITTGDYTNGYGANVDAGAGAGSITLTGQRNYTGTKTVQFDIEKRPLTGAAITLEAASYAYTGGEVKPAVTGVVVDGITVPASAFDVSYQNNINAGTATVTVTAKAGGNFTDSASTTFTITSSGGNGGGSSSGGGGSSSSSDQETAPQSSYTVTGDKISQSISRYDLQRLENTGKSLTLSCDKAGMTFTPAALRAILAAVPATAYNITFTAAPADISAFPDAAALIGSRPVYDFTISYKDSSGNPVTVTVNLPAGQAAVTLNYSPASGETDGSLFMVYVDGKGAVTWLDKSSYKNGKVLADAPHFSTYGVAYRAPAPVFTDITNHWAKADIEFVAARGLLTGTGNNQFSPDATMTRGMFTTALGRLAGISPDSYTTRSFTDVKADAYYAAYAEWATQKGIVSGTGEGVFSPDAPVTREQMAVILTNYAGQMGFLLPATLNEAVFADNASISEWAAKEVKAMQMAGIIKGRDGNQFDPQASATRAEVSAVLRRFMEIVIEPTTAQGWTKNDSGHWLYYKSGKALTGWREIGGKWYYFDENGVMAVNTKIDGYEIGPDGARK